MSDATHHVLHRATLTLRTPLGTPLAGDTLFGQLCWTLRETAGDAELRRRLDGYTTGKPWLVVSDGFPSGYLPRPTLPRHLDDLAAGPDACKASRKADRQKRWIACRHAGETLLAMPRVADDDTVAYGGQAPRHDIQAHNTLNRLSGTTGEGAFAPYTAPRIHHAVDQKIDLYLLLDEQRVSAAETVALLAALGDGGYGRDASVGLGKFTVDSLQPAAFASPAAASAYWTLAPCAPQGQGFTAERSYWRVLTRFGRHGNILATTGKPFKTPILLAATGAVFTPADGWRRRLFIGQGLGGDGRLSKAETATVHQGYSPVVPIALEHTP
ncbi:MAG TPA: hypothetical protein PKZ22_03660 [Accumulibacter sp.]|jgi:CRISPR-associated protein Csm4|nr:hypothetical protein [Accumulibacter sp.]